MSDELLRKLERDVAADGSDAARIRLATELERRGQGDEATAVLFEALAAHPQSGEVRRALGHFRGPSPTEWSHPQADARNTRRSTARGPKGTGRIIERRQLAPWESATFNTTQDERLRDPEPIPPPLRAGRYVYYSLGTGRQVLATTSDGHVVSQNFGASGFEWSANREGKIAWRHLMPFPIDSEGNPREQEGDPNWWSRPHAVIASDATVYAVTSFRRLLAIEPTGAIRFDQEVPSKVNALALDEKRELLHVLYSHPVGLSTRELTRGTELRWTSLAPLGAAHNAIVCDDGRVACVSPFREVGIVGPSGDLERTLPFAEKIGGAEGALTPWGELVVVSFDPTGSTVHLFDPASGARRGNFNAPDCRGAPAIDAAGTLYLDGGARAVVGWDLVQHSVRYTLDRPSYWREPDHPSSQLAIREDELAYIELSPKEGVILVRVGS